MSESHHPAYFGENKPTRHTLRRADMWGHLAELNTNEDFWPELILKVSEGNFLSTCAKEIGVHHGILRNWIRGDKKREEQYQQAEKDGKRRRMEQVMEKVHALAITEIAETPSHTDVLRAAEIALKHSGESGQAEPPKIPGISITFVTAETPRVVDGSTISSET